MEATPPAEEIEARCRFVFNHRGGRYGLTTDGALAVAASHALLSYTQYTRYHVQNEKGYWQPVTEYEIQFATPLSAKDLGLIQPAAQLH